MRKNFTFRIEEEQLIKLHFLSELNKRSVNNQLEVLVGQFILDYEKENGQIPVSAVE